MDNSPGRGCRTATWLCAITLAATVGCAGREGGERPQLVEVARPDLSAMIPRGADRIQRMRTALDAITANDETNV